MSGTQRDQSIILTRAALAAWLETSGWGPAQLAKAMRAVGHSNVLSGERIDFFVRGVIDVNRHYITDLNLFMRNEPSRMPFDGWLTRVMNRRAEAIRLGQERIIARRIEVENSRADYVRRQLAGEHQSKRTKPGVLFGLDKSTIAALNGGVPS